MSLSHEEALVRYDPKVASRETLGKILTNFGYTIRDPGKGVVASVNNKKIILGKPLFLIEYGVKFNQGQSNTIHELSEKGETGIGIREFFGAVLPESKAQKIRELQKQGYKIAIVGDGCNGRVCE